MASRVQKMYNELATESRESWEWDKTHTASPWECKPGDAPKVVELPAYAWPGGYTIEYQTGQGSILCAHCATKSLVDPDESDKAADYGTLEGGLPVQCDGCQYWLIPSLGNYQPDTDMTDSEYDSFVAVCDEDNRAILAQRESAATVA